jgi:glycosyltransferase involved in cell wall biosynthesis
MAFGGNTNTVISSQLRANALGSNGTHRRTASCLKLSILMPAYNEQRTIAEAVASVLRTSFPFDMELIVVNDGSTDATRTILAGLNHPDAVVIHHDRNLGKGAALQTAAEIATGTHLVPFDSDLEYDPNDLVAMMQPVIGGRCDVVYGARLRGANTRYQSYRHSLGNLALTIAASALYDTHLSDLHTCLKLVPVRVFREFALTEKGFGLDTEITAKLLKSGARPFEVPVSYHSRSVANGKKITWRDGVKCLQVLFRVRFTQQHPTPVEHTEDSLDLLAASLDTLGQIHAVESTVLGDPTVLEGEPRVGAVAA